MIDNKLSRVRRRHVITVFTRTPFVPGGTVLHGCVISIGDVLANIPISEANVSFGKKKGK